MTIDLHSFTAPYALDALEPLERARFEAHLESCEDCREELAGFAATVGRVGESLSQTPPPGLRARLLEEISDTPQQRPLVAPTGRLRRALPRMAMAAAVVVGAVGAGGYVVEHQRAEEISASNVAISTVLGDPNAETQAKSFATGGSLRVVMSAKSDAAVVVTDGLKAPEGGKVYQLWMIDDSGPHSQGTFTTSSTTVMKDLGTANRIALTVEPAGGSKQPTAAPIATVGV